MSGQRHGARPARGVPDSTEGDSRETRIFVTFEGGNGTGKTTQARRLADWLSERGHRVVLTREPDGTPEGGAIRGLFSGEGRSWDVVSEMLLFLAARREHCLKVILPALQRGEWVVCDRFSDSGRVCQGAAGGGDERLFLDLSRLAVPALAPDLTFVLDLPVGEALERTGRRGRETDRFEGRTAVYHEAVRQAFLELAGREPDRCRIIDASACADTQAGRIRDILAGVIASRMATTGN